MRNYVERPSFKSMDIEQITNEAKVKQAEKFLEKAETVRQILFELSVEYIYIEEWFDADDIRDALRLIVGARSDCHLEMARIKHLMQQTENDD